MTWFGLRIEPITSQTLGGCANYYATDAGLLYDNRDTKYTYKNISFYKIHEIILALTALHW